MLESIMLKALTLVCRVRVRWQVCLSSIWQITSFFYPLLSWERPYRWEICTELNVERYVLRRDGAIGFSHPYGTHDDVFWSIALAVYATSNMEPEPFLTVVPRE